MQRSLGFVLGVGVVVGITAAAAAGDADSPDVRQMIAQRPFVEAATVIKNAVDARPHSGYAGIVLEDGAVALWWKGDVPAYVVAAVAQANRVAPVRIAPARHSRGELRAAAARIRKQYGRDAIHAIKDPGDGSRLILAVPLAKAQTREATSSAMATVGVETEVVAEEEMKPISRDNDAAPWKGGATIVNATIGAACTSGFGVLAAGRPAILTAGHCATANGQRFQDASGEFIGNSAQKTGHDQMIIPTTSTTNLIYVGPRSSNTTKTVTRWEQCFIGELLCQSGVTTAQAIGSELCRIRVESFNTDSESLVEARQIDGQTGARPGDSGGPLYVDLGTTVIAKGTMTRTAGAGVGFQDIPTANADFGGIQIPGGAPTPTATTPVATPTANPNALVTIYQHCNFTGWSASFTGTGTFNLASLQAAGVVNDDASSIRVRPGFSAVLFANDGQTGTSITLTGDDSCLVDNTFNDVLSSMRIQGGGTPTATARARATATTRATPTATSGPRATPTSGGTTTWVPNVNYTVGAVVTYSGLSYRCIQAHRSQVGWEPPNVPALWTRN